MQILRILSAVLLAGLTTSSWVGEKASKPLTLKEDLAKLEGTWELVTPENGVDIYLTFSKEKLSAITSRAGKGTRKWDPEHFDLKDKGKHRAISPVKDPDGKRDEGFTSDIIYRFDGDKLIIEDGKWVGQGQLKGTWQRTSALPSAAAKEEMKKLDGIWAIESATFQGKSHTEHGELIIAGSNWTFKSAKGKEEKRTYRINPSLNPKRVDLFPEKETPDSPTLRGIYQLDGDTLRLCVFIFRPALMSDNEGILFVLKRKKS
jgi:uncharacterized protein (TIGR03067 family)